MENQYLKPLLSLLPSVVVYARSDNTFKNYYNAFGAWETWAKIYGVCQLPAQPFSFALYLLARIQQGATHAVVKGAFYGVKYVHSFYMQPDLTEQVLVINMFEAAKRLDTHVVTAREPITAAILQKLYTVTVKSQGSLNGVRVMFFCNLGYSGFLWYEE